MTKTIRKFINWKVWIFGALSAIIGGGANAITVMVIKPEDFNFADGWTPLWQFSAISAIISLAFYLKQSPVPPEVTEEIEQ